MQVAWQSMSYIYPTELAMFIYHTSAKYESWKNITSQINKDLFFKNLMQLLYMTKVNPGV
jgi:hypothetical protein